MVHIFKTDSCDFGFEGGDEAEYGGGERLTLYGLCDNLMCLYGILDDCCWSMGASEDERRPMGLRTARRCSEFLTARHCGAFLTARHCGEFLCGETIVVGVVSGVCWCCAASGREGLCMEVAGTMVVVASFSAMR